MIQIENTPNPNAIKFLCENTISEIGTVEFQRNKIEKIHYHSKSNSLDSLNLLPKKKWV